MSAMQQMLLGTKTGGSAAVTLLGSTFTTGVGSKTVTATPAVNDLIVVFIAYTNAPIVSVDDNQSGVYTLVQSAVKGAGIDGINVYVRNALVGSAVSTIYTLTTDATDTGGGLVVLKVTGMTVAGSAAIRQSAVQSNQAGGGTPTTTLASAALAGNALLGAILNAANPATMTPRSGWTEQVDLGYITPTAGIEVMTINSGETATAIAWGSTSASAFCDLVIELAV